MAVRAHNQPGPERVQALAKQDRVDCCPLGLARNGHVGRLEDGNVTQGPSFISHKATWGSKGLCPFYSSMPRVLRPFRPRPAQCELMIARIRSLPVFCYRLSPVESSKPVAPKREFQWDH